MIRIQVREFFIHDEEDTLNKFLGELLPENLIDIKYSIIDKKGWESDDDHETYETATRKACCLVIYKTNLPEQQSTTSVNHKDKS